MTTPATPSPRAPAPPPVCGSLSWRRATAARAPRSGAGSARVISPSRASRPATASGSASTEGARVRGASSRMPGRRYVPRQALFAAAPGRVSIRVIAASFLGRWWPQRGSQPSTRSRGRSRGYSTRDPLPVYQTVEQAVNGDVGGPAIPSLHRRSHEPKPGRQDPRCHRDADTRPASGHRSRPRLEPMSRHPWATTQTNTRASLSAGEMSRSYFCVSALNVPRSV